MTRRKATVGVVLIVLAILVLTLALVRPAFPGVPSVDATFSLQTTAAPLDLDSYELLDRTVPSAQANRLLATAEGREMLARENGAVPVTGELVDLGRESFYTGSFGNEYFFSDVIGVLDGPIDMAVMGRAIIALRGGHTDDLRVRITETVEIGGRTFEEGEEVSTGLDVPPGWLLPLGMRMYLVGGQPKIGVTCALCHATVEPMSGLIVEGAPNHDLDTGLLLAMASNSAAMFRNTGLDPLTFPATGKSYLDSTGLERQLPDPQALEREVDRHLLAWPPGNFDSTIDLVNNPSQIPTSFTFEAWPYGWNGFSAAGWFDGLTTLNNNVHALNSDATTGFAMSAEMLGMDADTYMGVLLQEAASPGMRLPAGEAPLEFFEAVNPSRLGPALNSVTPMPEYPHGSVFIPDGLMINSPGMPFAEELNAISAFQNTLAPPPVAEDREAVEHGAQVFGQAGCAGCHSGRRFTNNRVIPLSVIGTQPSRAGALTGFARVLESPRTWPPSLEVPLPRDAPTLEVPVDEAKLEILSRAYGLEGAEVGYKVPSLIGLAVSAPYLHDGGVAAAAGAFSLEDERYEIAGGGLGLPGTLLRGLDVDPRASLRALVDRRLREAVVAANREHPGPTLANADGSGHTFWVDEPAGFDSNDQDALVAFLLSLDDDPEVLPVGVDD
ncbi:MAG: hypothetical protein WD273_08260 [Trueperaceae bacterium]